MWAWLAQLRTSHITRALVVALLLLALLHGSHLAHWEEHTVLDGEDHHHLHTNGSHTHWYRRVHASGKGRSDSLLPFLWRTGGQVSSFPQVPWAGPMRDVHIVGGRKVENMHRCDDSRFKKLVPPRDPSAPLGKAGRLVTHCLGGLNQQRFQVVESVLVAWLTNAILVDPLLGLHLAWNDDSKLSEIFDTSHLHAKLAHVVKFVDLEAALPVQGKLTPPTAARFEWWEEKVPLLLKRVHTMEITSMHRRLNTSYAAMPEPMRFLWCYVNFHALRFVAPIEQLAIRAVERMHGRFTAVHLRLEEDMLAKLGPACLPTRLEPTERAALAKKLVSYAQTVWGSQWAAMDDNRATQNGKCPLTERQTIELLVALGLSSNTTIYIASGKPHEVFKHANEAFDTTRALFPDSLFPKLVTKHDLLTSAELKLLGGSPSKLAALDYLVCLYAELFVQTLGGNMGHSLRVHRSYLGRYTLYPNRRGLVPLYGNGSHLGTPGFIQQVRAVHPGKDLRWVGQPLPTHGSVRALYLTPSVHNGRVPVGLESEAKRCLCQGGKATSDNALYLLANAAPLNVTGGRKSGGGGGGGRGFAPPSKAGNAARRAR